MKYKCSECGHEVVNIDDALTGCIGRNAIWIVCAECSEHVGCSLDLCVVAPRKTSGEGAHT